MLEVKILLFLPFLVFFEESIYILHKSQFTKKYLMTQFFISRTMGVIQLYYFGSTLHEIKRPIIILGNSLRFDSFFCRVAFSGKVVFLTLRIVSYLSKLLELNRIKKFVIQYTLDILLHSGICVWRQAPKIYGKFLILPKFWIVYTSKAFCQIGRLYLIEIF